MYDHIFEKIYHVLEILEVSKVYRNRHIGSKLLHYITDYYANEIIITQTINGFLFFTILMDGII